MRAQRPDVYTICAVDWARVDVLSSMQTLHHGGSNKVPHILGRGGDCAR